MTYGLVPTTTTTKVGWFPLVESEVHYQLADVQLSATLTQTYTSKYMVPVEVAYTFPLPSDAAVHAFHAVIDGKRTIKGVVKGKVEAQNVYDEAISQGKTAALVSQANVEVFRITLGNLHPDQIIACTIAFSSPIVQEGPLDSLRLTFPTSIYPRYGAPPQGATFFQPIGHDINCELDLTISIEMTGPVVSISSPSHPISVNLGSARLADDQEDADIFNPKMAHVSLSSVAPLDRDVVVILKCQGLDSPRCMVESYTTAEGAEEDTDAYALTFVPRFQVPNIEKQEYIFLVDRSGSMRGGKISSVRQSLQIILKSLPSQNTTFNIISFGSRTSALFSSGSQKYNEDSVGTAELHIRSLQADFGGTEMLAALREAVGSSSGYKDPDESVITSVFVLTDGESWDLDNVFNFVRDSVEKSQRRLRMFVCGIGNSVSKAMCDGIAHSGNGVSIFVGENEKPDSKLMGLLRAAKGALVTDIQVDWGVKSTPMVTDPNDGDFEIVSAQEKPVAEEKPKEEPALSLFDPNVKLTSKDVNGQLGPKPIELPPPPLIQQSPGNENIPHMYPGFRTSIFAIIKRTSAPLASIKISGKVLGRPVQLEVPVTSISRASLGTGGKAIHVLAARSLIENLEAGKDVAMRKAEVKRLGLRYGLASSETSFVAFDEKSHDEYAVPVEKVEKEKAKQQNFSGFTFKRPYATAGGNQGIVNAIPKPQPVQAHQGSGQLLSFPIPSAPSLAPAGLFGLHQQTSTPPSLPFGSFGSSGPAGATFLDTVFNNFPASSPMSLNIFGKPVVSQQQPVAPPPPSFNLFGRSNALPQDKHSASPSPFGSFGSCSAPPQGSALEGSSAPPPPGSRLFGSSTASTCSFSGVPLAPMHAKIPTRSTTSMSRSLSLDHTATAGLHIAERRRHRMAMDTTLQTETASKDVAVIDVARFAELQTFSGAFLPQAFTQLSNGIGTVAVPADLDEIDSKETIWSTLLCIALLRVRFAAEKDVWEAMEDKALDWARDEYGDELVEKMLKMACEIVKAA